MLARAMARLLAVALTSAAAAAGTAVAPAHAATCPSASGVSVVADFGGLGGGVQTACDPGSGETAWKQFEDSVADFGTVDAKHVEAFRALLASLATLQHTEELDRVS